MNVLQIIKIATNNVHVVIAKILQEMIKLLNRQKEMLKKKEFIIVVQNKKDVIVKNHFVKRNIVNVSMQVYHVQMLVNVLIVQIKTYKVVIDQYKNYLK